MSITKLIMRWKSYKRIVIAKTIWPRVSEMDSYAEKNIALAFCIFFPTGNNMCTLHGHSSDRKFSM